MSADMPSPLSDPVGLDSLAERLAADMRQRWQAGEQPTTEDYLARYPSLREQPAAAAELIWEEVCLRREHGQADGADEVLRRFPQWASRLRVLLEVNEALGVDAEPDYPAEGDRLGDFQLLRELGRGLRGRVFLARQSSLAGRLVVLKLTPHGDLEHQALARLQHTHIVPLYSAFDYPQKHLRVLCLPYFGGASLAAVLDGLAAVPVERRTGAAVWRVLAGDECAVPPHFARAGYVDLVCWIGACLAEALAFAHERDLVHLDVKPSNILMTAEGLPMLLDFHLAHEPLPAGAPAPPWLGGTPAYLSCEQHEALECVRCGQAIAAPVDGRSDLYSLGLVLYEMLAGKRPAAGAVVPLARCNRQVSTGLSDMIGRCLATRAEDRYPTAADLASDLRRHLAGQPLRGVRNRDLRERWRKWRRRRPYALGVLGLWAVLLAGAGLAGGYVIDRLGQGRTALDEGNAQMQQGEFVAARGAYRRGLAVAGGLPLGGGLRSELAVGLGRAGWAEAAGQLHRVADQLRGLYGSDSLPDDELASVEQLSRRLWEDRSSILADLQADLPASAREQVREDLIELALLWSHLRVRQAGPAGVAGARREALGVLEEMDRALGPSIVLVSEAAQHAEQLGLVDKAKDARKRARRMAPRSAWEHYALGCASLRAGEPGKARSSLERAIDRDPHSFWAHFYLGRCNLQLGRPAEAVLPFSVCIALRPDEPLGYLHRSLAHARLGQHDRAVRDADRAVKLRPQDRAARALREALDKAP
jgi:tetratricopeptide (TPR) repeat protein